jgi:hypothetical protein
MQAIGRAWMLGKRGSGYSGRRRSRNAVIHVSCCTDTAGWRSFFLDKSIMFRFKVLYRVNHYTRDAVPHEKTGRLPRFVVDRYTRYRLERGV